MRIANKAKFTRQTYACGASWPPQTILTNLHEDLERHRGLCATLPDGQLVVGILADDVEIVEEQPSAFSVSLAEEIFNDAFYASNIFNKGKCAEIIQRRVEPLERQRDELGALLKRALPACEYSAMKWKDKEGREDRVKLPDEIKQALARIKEGE